MPQKSMSRATGKLIDISDCYDCPFPIFTTQEGESLLQLSKRNISKPHHFDFQAVQNEPTLRAQLLTQVEFLECMKLAAFHGPAYMELMLEFYTTFKADSVRTYKCRLGGKEVTLDETLLLGMLGINYEGIDLESPHGFGELSFWGKILDAPRGSDGRYPGSQIKDDALFYTYKFIGHVIFGKGEVNKMTSLELLVLWSAHRRIKPSLPEQIFLAIATSQLESRFKLAFGNLITALAIHANIDLSKDGEYEKLESCVINIVPHIGGQYRPRKSITKRARPNVGESSRAGENNEQEGMSEWMKTTSEKIEGIMIANNARDKEDASFRRNIMKRFDSVKERQEKYREEDRKEHTSIMDLIKSCFCANQDAVKGNKGIRIEEVRDEGDPRGCDDMNQNEGFCPFEGNPVCDENVGGEYHGTDGSHYGHVDNIVKDNPSAITLYEGGTPLNEFRNDEELNEDDDIDSDDIQEAENTRTMTMQTGYGEGSEDYLDTSNPMALDDEDGPVDPLPFKIYQRRQGGRRSNAAAMDPESAMMFPIFGQDDDSEDDE